MNELVHLVSVRLTTDSMGNSVTKDEKMTKVFAQKKSVSQREYFSAAQEGFRPELVLKVWSHEYSGQKYVICDNERYEIYRTFEKNGAAELYLRKCINGGG